MNIFFHSLFAKKCIWDHMIDINYFYNLQWICNLDGQILYGIMWERVRILFILWNHDGLLHVCKPRNRICWFVCFFENLFRKYHNFFIYEYWPNVLPGWKKDNAYNVQKDKKVEPDVIEFGRFFTKKFIDDIDLTSEVNLLEQFTKYIQAKDFSEITSWG